MINNESPLMRLPANLEPLQRAYLDGIRFAVEMIDSSYRTLHAALFGLSIQERDEATFGQHVTVAVQSAWSVIDSGNRLGTLVRSMPLVKRTDAKRRVLRRTDELRGLRNGAQHMDEQLRRHRDVPAWGWLSWMAGRGDEVASMFILSTGTLIPGPSAGVRMPKDFLLPVDRITLLAWGETVSLTDFHEEVVVYVRWLENQLRDQFHDHPTAGSDLLAEIQLRPVRLNHPADGTD